MIACTYCYQAAGKTSIMDKPGSQPSKQQLATSWPAGQPASRPAGQPASQPLPQDLVAKLNPNKEEGKLVLITRRPGFRTGTSQARECASSCSHNRDRAPRLLQRF